MKKFAIVATAILASSAVLQGAVRLTYMIDQKPTPISWKVSDFPLRYQVDPSLSSNLPEIERGFGAWASVPQSVVRFGAPAMAASGAGKDGLNAVTVTDGLFDQSGFIAYTTTWFGDDGTLYEADIQLDRSVLQNNTVEMFMKHEVGHFLGFDHTANFSSIMYPFVGATNVLDPADELGVSATYPAADFGRDRAEIRGQVSAPSGGLFAAQIVAVNAAGSPVATALTDRNGRFDLRGLPAGSYTLYAEPLDGPVDTRHLSGIYSDGASKFRTDFADGGAGLVVAANEMREVSLQPDVTPATLNPRWIGTFVGAPSTLSLSSTMSRVKQGSTISIAVGGDGFVSGMTTFELGTSKLQRVSDFSYGPNYVWATFQVSADAPAGPLVVLVRNGNETATLTGALRVEEKGSSRPRPVR